MNARLHVCDAQLRPIFTSFISLININQMDTSRAANERGEGVRKYIPRNKKDAIPKPQAKVFHIFDHDKKYIATYLWRKVQERSIFSVVWVCVV